MTGRPGETAEISKEGGRDRRGEKVGQRAENRKKPGEPETDPTATKRPGHTREKQAAQGLREEARRADRKHRKTEIASQGKGQDPHQGGARHRHERKARKAGGRRDQK